MPRFVITREFAEQLQLDKPTAAKVQEVNDDIGVQWLFSFLSADKRKSYCLYEAPSADAVREAAERLQLPADEVVEIGGELRPEMFT